MLLFLDTETTGISRLQDRLVQLAWVLTNESGKVLDTRSSIVKPDGFVIPAAAANIHRITTDTARTQGIPLLQCLEQLYSLKSQVSVLVAHNLEFDTGILISEFKRVGLQYPFDGTPCVCTMKSSVQFCKLPKPYGKSGYKWPRLDELHRKLFGIDFKNAHDARADVQACMKCFFALEILEIIKLPKSVCKRASTAQNNSSIISVADVPALNDMGIVISNEDNVKIPNIIIKGQATNQEEIASPANTPVANTTTLKPKQRRSKSENIRHDRETALYQYVKNLSKEERKLSITFLGSNLNRFISSLHFIKWAKDRKLITVKDFFVYSYIAPPDRYNDYSELLRLMEWTACGLIQTLDRSIDEDITYDIGRFFACEWLLRLINIHNKDIRTVRARYGDRISSFAHANISSTSNFVQNELLDSTSDLWMNLSQEAALLHSIFGGLELAVKQTRPPIKVKQAMYGVLLSLPPPMRAVLCSVYEIAPTNKYCQLASDEEMARIAKFSHVKREYIKNRALSMLRQPSCSESLRKFIPSQKEPELSISEYGQVFFDAVLAYNATRRDRSKQGLLHELISQLNQVVGPFSETRRIDIDLVDTNALMNVSLDELNLTVRTVTCLKAENIFTIADLVKLSEADLCHVPRLGFPSINEIKEVLGMLRLHLYKSSSE